jgi:hypothetical protein
MTQETKQVGTYTVSKFGTLESVRANIFAEQAAKLKRKPPNGGELSEDDEIYNKWLDHWVGIAAVVQPKITIEEFAELEPSEYGKLVAAIGEVNSELDEFAAAPVSEQDSKKKKSNRRGKSQTT